MTLRIAQCRCGAVQARCAGEPVRVSVCHCLDCQRRSGSAFAAQVRFPIGDVAISGETRSYVHVGDSGNKASFDFCPACAATIAYTLESWPEVIAIPIGAFADPDFSPHPAFSVYENRKHRWVEIRGDDVEHD